VSESPLLLLTSTAAKRAAGVSHSLDLTGVADQTSITQFDTGQKYTQGSSGAQNAIVQYGSLTLPVTSLPNGATSYATYEFARTSRKVRTVGMTFRAWTATGGTTSPTFALGVFGATGLSPANSCAHLAMTQTTWQLTTVVNSVVTPVPGGTGSHSLAADTTYSAQVQIDYAAGTVTVWLPKSLDKPLTLSVPQVNSMLYPIGFSEMVLTANTNLFPQTFAWWCDADRQQGLA
jgi:hypothetical protein